MPRKKLTRLDRKFKGMLLSGMSIPKVSRSLGITERQGYNIRDKLVALGEIRKVPGTRSPALYEDLQNCENHPPTGGGDEKFQFTPPSSDFTGPPSPADSPEKGASEASERVVACATLSNYAGVSTARDCPEGYGAAHLTGCVTMMIRAVGTFDVIRDRRGLTIGYWDSKPKPIQGCVIHSGVIHMQGQEVGFTFRIGNRGSRTFQIYPKRIFVDPLRFPDSEAVMALFVDRSLYIAECLRATGWQLTDPSVKGDLHLAWPGHPLVQHFDARVHMDNGDLVMDTSPGIPEMEMEDFVSDPDAWTKAQLMAQLPTRFLALEAREGEDRMAIAGQTRSIRSVAADLEALKGLCIQINDVLVELSASQSAVLQLLKSQVEISASQAEFNQMLQRQSVAGPDSQGTAPYQPAVNSSSKVPPEGYQ